MPESVTEVVANPVTAILGAVAIVGGWLPAGIDAFLSTVWGQAGTFFAVTSISASQLAPLIEWLPVDVLSGAAIVFALIFVANRLNRLRIAYTENLNDN